MVDTPAIKFENISKTFQTADNEVKAVQNVNLEIKSGEVFGIVGFSGAGKSTLVRMLNGLEKPTEGKILIHGKRVDNLAGRDLREQRKKIGIIFQHFNLLWSRTVLENITFPLEIAHVPKNERIEKAKKLAELGYYINVGELDKIDAVTKAHIALDATTNPQNKEKLLAEFGHIPNKGEFIETIMNENCPAYVKKESVTPKEAAEIIREAKGKVVLAHPVAYEHEDNLTDEDILEIVKDMKPDGLEANYLYVDRNNNKFDETAKWNEFAKENNLFVTVGSDFHNKDGLRPEIGFVNTNFTLSDEKIDEILENLSK